MIKELLAHDGNLTDKRRADLEKRMKDYAEQSSMREKIAEEAERDSVDMKMAEYMEGHIGEEYDGTISSVMNFGLFVQLNNMIEGLVHISEIKGDYYTFDETTHTLRGEKKGKMYKLGQKVRVVVTNASKENSTIDFNLVEGNKNGNNKQEVITIDEDKKSVIKQIFWDMNELSSEVKDEIVTEQGINTDEIPRQVQKKVLHIKINNKTIEQMKILYNFNSEQNRQLLELTDSRYSNLWNNVIYGSNNSGDYLSWKQYGQSWSNKRIGNTNSTLGQIGCLITSISILIEKSGCNTAIKPFNPGTFLDALNKNNAFDESGNLKFSGVTKAVPNFKYAGNINLRGKTKEEKLSIIKQYYNQGYYLAVEVKGATPGNQHWVALTEINDNNITIVDPGSNATNLWSYYEWSKTSQFNYYKVI